MLKIAIVDDEENFRNQILEYLDSFQKEIGETFRVSVFSDGDGIVEGYDASYDIILMDVEMPLMDGMAAAEEIRKLDRQVVIIFITNMAQYAIRGYRVDALDYILKPISYFAFSETLRKAMGRLPDKKAYQMVISTKSGTTRLDVTKIVYIESCRHTMEIHTTSEIYQANITMRELEVELLSHGFFRINKGYLVNLSYVNGVADGNAQVGSELLPISRSKKKEFMEALMSNISGTTC